MKDAQETFGELGTGNLTAGAIIGGDYVATFLVHTGLEGPTYLMQESSVLIPTCQGCTPDLSRIRMALAECWEAMELTQGIDFNRFMLCLPSWCTKGRGSFASIPITHDNRIPGFRYPKIRLRDVLALIRKASESSESHDATVNFKPRHFELESGRRVADPVGEMSPALSVEAEVVKADRGFVEGVLNCLRALCLRVDVLTSTDDVLGGCLTDQELTCSDVGALYCGRRYSTFGLFEQGSLRYSTAWERGSESVLAGAAHELSVTRDVIASVVGQPDLFMFSGDPNDPICSLPLFGRAGANPILRDLERAAGETVSAIVSDVERALNGALRNCALNVGRFVVVGEDPLTYRLLKAYLEEKFGLPCRIGVPVEVQVSRDIEIIGFPPIVGMVRRNMQLPPFGYQAFLERYNETPFSLISRQGGDRARAMLWNVAQRVANRLTDGPTCQAVPDQDFSSFNDPSPPTKRRRVLRVRRKRRNRRKAQHLSARLRSYINSLLM